MAINSKSFRARHGLSVGDDATYIEAVDNSGAWVGSTIALTKGGTGLSTYAAGDMLYSATANPTALTKLTIGSASKILRSTGTIPAWSTSTYPDQASASAGSFLRSDGTNVVNSTLILPNAATANDLLYASSANTIGNITTANSSILITNGSGVPSWGTTLPAHSVTTSVTVPLVQGSTAASGTLTLTSTSSATKATAGILMSENISSSSTSTGTLVVTGGVGVGGNLYVGGTINITGNVTLSGSGNSVGTVTSGTWNGTAIDMTRGGAGAALTASAGGIVYSGASSLSVLAGTATASKILLSGASAAPSWSTATYPGTAASAGKILRADGTNWSASTATYPDVATTAGTLLRADGTNWSATSLTFPTSTATVGGLIFSSAANTVTETNTNLTWSNTTNVLNLGSGALVKVNAAATTANTVLGINSGNTGHEYKSISAGSGIAVSHSAGAITISLSGAVGGATLPDANTFSSFEVGRYLQVGSADSSVVKTITAASWATNTATFTSASHGLTVDQRIIVYGVSPAGYNGAYTIKTVATNTFTVDLSTNPGTYTSGGSISYQLNGIDTTNALEIRAGAGTSLTNLISAYSTNNQTTKVFGVTTAGSVSAAGKLLIANDDGTNNAVVSVAKFTHTTSGTPAIGIGTAIEIESENSAGTLKVAGQLEIAATNVTASSEAYDLRLKAMSAGTLSTVLQASANALYGSNIASYNLLISPTSNATNGSLTLTDINYTMATVPNLNAVSGTVTNVIIDQIAKAGVRTIKYVVQATQSTGFNSREIIVVHDGTTPVWTEYGQVTAGTYTDYSYDFNLGTTNLEFRVTGTSLPTTTYKIHRTYLTQ